ncbi:MAG: hypothetical protein ACHQET_11370, partial [Chitinophagales bacterium]
DTLQYFQKFKILWKYAQTYLIDHEYGDWYPGGLDTDPQMKTALKGQIWKGTYHVFRALANCVERLKPDKISPTVPRELRLEKTNKSFSLKWKASTDNERVLGYNIYLNGRRVGFTPLTWFSMNDFEQQKASEISIRALDLQGNESAFSNKVIF